MNEEIETSLIAFLLSDQDVRGMLQTLPEPPRIYPNAVPQGVSPENLLLVYWMIQRMEPGQLGAPTEFVKARIMLECRQRAASPKQARLLSKKIMLCTGPTPGGRKFHGYAGNWPNGFVVQKVYVMDVSYRLERAVKATEQGTHVIMMEVEVFWNSAQ